MTNTTKVQVPIDKAAVLTLFSKLPLAAQKGLLAGLAAGLAASEGRTNDDSKTSSAAPAS